PRSRDARAGLRRLANRQGQLAARGATRRTVRARCGNRRHASLRRDGDHPLRLRGHYVGVEHLIGEFRRRHPDHARRLRVSTKLVPDLESLPRLTRSDVRHIVDTALARLGPGRLDLVQFHWWDYRVPGYVEAMHWLADLRSAGKVELM